jgi:hypothetical protein
MGISKIGYLFAANVDSLGSTNQAKTSQQQQPSQGQITPGAPASTEAAVISPTFGQSRPAQGESGKEGRLQELKAQVQKGEYKPALSDVAVSVIRDLA